MPSACSIIRHRVPASARRPPAHPEGQVQVTGGPAASPAQGKGGQSAGLSGESQPYCDLGRRSGKSSGKEVKGHGPRAGTPPSLHWTPGTGSNGPDGLPRRLWAGGGLQEGQEVVKSLLQVCLRTFKHPSHLARVCTHTHTHTHTHWFSVTRGLVGMVPGAGRGLRAGAIQPPEAPVARITVRAGLAGRCPRWKYKMCVGEIILQAS